VDSVGRSIYLLGGVSCCADPSISGWPLVTTRILDEIADARGNFVHIRVGPYSSTLFEGPEFQPSPAFWSRVRGLIEHAYSRGIVVEVDVIDGWVLERGHNHNYFGWDGAITHSRPDVEQLEWVNEVMRNTSEYPNVIYQISNESFDVGASGEWEGGIVTQIRRHTGAMIGSNIQREVARGYANYVTFHNLGVRSPMYGRATMVNEFGDDPLAPEEWEAAARDARRRGVSIHLWRGGMDDASWRDSLQRLKRIQEGN